MDATSCCLTTSRSTSSTASWTDDIDTLAVPVLAHRLMAAKSAAGGSYGREALAEIAARIVASTPVPLGASGPA